MEHVTKIRIHKSIATIVLAIIPIAALTAAPDHRPDKHPKQGSSKVEAREADKLVASYESVSEALVNDDLDAARSAADSLAKVANQEDMPNIANTAGKVADASSLDEARKAFKSLSGQVIALAKGDEEYTVMTCPMVEDGRWLQSDKTVSNPYMGQKMPGCGMPASKKGMMMDGMKDMKCMKSCCMENTQEG